MDSLRYYDCAPLGAKEYYGFPVGGTGHLTMSDKERAEHDRKRRTDKPNHRYYYDKYARIFLIFWKAADEGIYECSNEEWQYLWNRYTYYRDRCMYYDLSSDEKDYEPEHQRQDTRVMWENLYALKREKRESDGHL